MEDKRTLLERAKFLSENYAGQPIGDDDFANGFILHNRENRVAILDVLHAEDSNGGEIAFEDMRKAAERAELIGRLKDTHQKLLKAGR
ncbi:hypothetical protein ACFPFP_02915 [Bradyrhizobium sp. GCM10023182]|uniref:Uncharacterized protein n=1 Tax=Bradyrhizobium zhengyangense TaxID=2911009 RepID=A0ABS9LFW3_9BRAD|nr:hypothetical protein [Bradyrhizobium zhengyangense]MCG2665880.1 hypothetical protein [Bradyrhizobium zhengyangense]